jgi:hypothetical protein
MDAITFIRQHLTAAHDLVEETMSDVTGNLLHPIPPGNANPLGATYAHVVISEDMLVHGILQGVPPLFGTTWAGRTGLSEPMPMPGPEWANYSSWARRVRIDLPVLREYAQAVYTNTDQYLATLSPDDLDKQLDLTRQGFGRVSLAWALSRLILGHVDNICGELAALKGIQGVKGYPF